MKKFARFPIFLALGTAVLIAPAVSLTAPLPLAAAAAVSVPTTVTPAADLRTTLAKVYGEHAYESVIAMQKLFDESESAGDASGLLGQNGNKMSGMIQDVYGVNKASKFGASWTLYNNNLKVYAAAARDNDGAGKKKALSNLRAYASDFGKFMHTLNSRIDAGKLEQDLDAYTDLLLKSFDAYADGRYDEAYSAAHDAYTQSARVGASLATSIAAQFPAKYKRTTTQTEAAYFRQHMDQALGEHAFLAMLLLEKGSDKKPDYANVKKALDANTEAMASTHKRLFGEGAAKTFKALWNRHINDYITYMNATLIDDAAGRRAAKADLDDFVADLTAFQTSRLPLNKTKTMQGHALHGQHVLAVFDTYHQGDYDRTYRLMGVGYNHMWMMGNMLSEAIVKKMPGMF
ncbi:hypothetical protein QWJ34_09050 [Saccharibacillus sp. CPCC 101409]|uniref:hypothetical protein n=1 Tax=Saccharibacillus sp. CPCC 101409 TaxID=3058041 RepID=UPI002671A7DC|nr:hypothetical protein [Saccharibacillus sp. CPCC 101409]MDO3409908.1 hypothetical protein [Saccharibacillus sp. CPCC 101409]